MRKDDADNAVALEMAYNAYNGMVQDTRDAIIDIYVRVCRKYAPIFNIGPLSVEPDYMALTDNSGKYCLVFLLKAKDTLIGEVSSCYTDDSSVTICTPRITMTIKLKNVKAARRRRIHG